MYQQQTWNEILQLLGALDERLARSTESFVSNARPNTDGRWLPDKIRDTVRSNLREVVTNLEEAFSRGGSYPRAWIKNYYVFSSRVLGEMDLSWTTLEDDIYAIDKRINERLEQLNGS